MSTTETRKRLPYADLTPEQHETIAKMKSLIVEDGDAAMDLGYALEAQTGRCVINPMCCSGCKDCGHVFYDGVAHLGRFAYAYCAEHQLVWLIAYEHAEETEAKQKARWDELGLDGYRMGPEWLV